MPYRASQGNHVSVHCVSLRAERSVSNGYLNNQTQLG
jgi:hypothetical protein